MEVDNEVRLLLRFYKDVSQNTDVILHKFQNFKQEKNPNYSLKISGTHIWIFINGVHKKYYSPHLHLEFEKRDENETHIRGLFGPDPTLWTFFMFLHFIIAGVFLIFCGILYSDYILKNSLTTDYVVLFLMFISWFLLYFIARQIRHNGNEQMHELEKLYKTILES
jgi:amino acid permease